MAYQWKKLYAMRPLRSSWYAQLVMTCNIRVEQDQVAPKLGIDRGDQPGFHIYTGVGGVVQGFTIFPYPPTPFLLGFDWDSLPPYPEGLGALYRHVIEGGRGRKGGRERGQKIPPPTPKNLFLYRKNLPLYPPKTVTKLHYPPYPSIDMEP